MSDTLTHFITAKRFLNGKTFSPDFMRGFYFGVQGPDIFFFGEGEGSFAFGDSIHDTVPKELFEKDCSMLPTKSQLYQGYAYGVILHYFGDRIMHQYVGYLVRKYKQPTTHSAMERDFDIALYQREFGKPIKTFPLKKYYKVDDRLTSTIYEYWHDRLSDRILTPHYVDKAVRKMFFLTGLLIRANPLVVALVKLKEKGEGIDGTLSCHLKTGDGLGNLNDEHSVWNSPIGEYTLSVEDIVQKGVDDFSAEFVLMQKYFEDKENYIFNHSVAFSCGK